MSAPGDATGEYPAAAGERRFAAPEDETSVELDWRPTVRTQAPITSAPIARGAGRAKWMLARRERVTVTGYRQRWTSTVLALLVITAVLTAVFLYAGHVRSQDTLPGSSTSSPANPTTATSLEPSTTPGGSKSAPVDDGEVLQLQP